MWFLKSLWSSVCVCVGWVLHGSPGTWGDLLPVFGGELGIGLGFPCVYKSVALSGSASVRMTASACSYKCCPLVVESSSLQFISVQTLSRVRLFATPWIAACQASLSIINSRSSLRLTSIESVMPSSHLIHCRPLLLLPPIPPSIRVFSNESTLPIRWPKY